MPAQRSDSLPSQTVKVSCKRRSTARLKSAVADEMCKQYDLKRAVRPLSICDDVEALECSQRRRHLNGCRAQFGMILQYLRYRHRHRSNHLRNLEPDSVSTSEERRGGLREGPGMMGPGERGGRCRCWREGVEVGSSKEKQLRESARARSNKRLGKTLMKTAAGFIQGQLDVESVQLVLFSPV